MHDYDKNMLHKNIYEEKGQYTEFSALVCERPRF